ncbi:MAG TPA: DnaA/Hda family protein [Planctomycetaceae bacterium]|nr:DnaA/Hda family protein [Planctomycetaceae bacterium]
MPPSPRQILLLPENRSVFEALQKLGTRSVSSTRKTRLIYVHGPAGTGKSLLVTRFVRDLLRKSPKIKAEIVTASTFAADLADASDAKTIDQFQARFRSLDLFVCEDLQSLRHRKESQQQLVHCLDHLADRGSTIVLTATSLPGHWTSFDPRLTDRCHGALSIGLKLPALSSRLKLIQHFAQEEHIPFPATAAKLMARELESSPRDLETAVNQLIELSRRSKQNISLELVEQFLKQDVVRPEIPLNQIIRQTAKYFDLNARDLKSESRRSDVVRARQIAMFLARQFTKQTQQEIARQLGKADHTAVIRAEKKIAQLLETDSLIRLQVAEIKEQLRS